MQLNRSRTALRQATQAVDELRAAKDNPELFRDRFVAAMGMALRVGSVINDETKGRRTPAFGAWWKQTQSDPLLVFMQDVRNAEFKRGEARQAAHHHVTVGAALLREHPLQQDEAGRDRRGHRRSPTLGPSKGRSVLPRHWALSSERAVLLPLAVTS